MTDIVTTSDIEFKGETDWGQIFSWQCPECKEELTASEFGNKEQECECGYSWELILYARGEK